MKKALLFFVAITAIHFSLNAQNSRFGFTAGGSLASYKISADNISITGDNKFGFTFGTLVDIPVSEKFSVQPALNFVQKGMVTSDDGGGSGVTVKYKTSVSLIELPVNFLFNSGGFFVGAGPSVAFGISGKGKTTYSDGSPDETIDLKFGNTEDDDLKGLDLGANMVAGYRLPGGLMFSFNYNMGLNNLVPSPVDTEKMKSHYFGFRLGFILGGEKKK